MKFTCSLLLPMPSAARWITFQMGVLLMSFYFVSTEKQGYGDHLFWCSLLGSTTLCGLLSLPLWREPCHLIFSLPQKKEKYSCNSRVLHVLPACPQPTTLAAPHGEAHSWQQHCYHGDAESRQTVIKKGRWSHKSFHIVFKGTQPHLK